MALSLIDLLDLPPHERSESNINLNIPSLKRKCDLFFYLADREAFELLQKSELFRSSSDLPLEVAQTNLCILLKGKVSLCHKTQTIVAPTDSPDPNKEGEEEKEEAKTDESKSKEKGATEKQSMSATARRIAVIQMVTAVLERRNTLKEEERVLSLAEKRKNSVEQGGENEAEHKEIQRPKGAGRPGGR